MGDPIKHKAPCISPDVGLLVVLLKFVPLLLAAIATNGRDVDHAVAELNEGAPLDGDV